MLLRATFLIAIYYCGIRSIHHAILANINFGIVSCCYIVSIVVNCAFGFLYFGEKINSKVIAGIIITVSGIMWISLAKGQAALVLREGDNNDADFNKMMSVMFALSVGMLNASQTIHAKFMMLQADYGVLNLTADTGTLFVAMCSVITLLNLINGS